MWWGLFFNFAANLGDQFTTGTSSSLLATSLWPTINSVFKVACVKIKHLFITLWSVLSICVHGCVCLKLLLAQYIFDTIVKIMDLMALKTQIRKYKYEMVQLLTYLETRPTSPSIACWLTNLISERKIIKFGSWALVHSLLSQTAETNCSWEQEHTFATMKGLEESTVDDYKNQL